MHNVAGEHTTQLFQGMGHITHRLSEELGDIVEVVPAVGPPVGYVVRRAGDAVCHVVLAVGALAESTSASKSAAERAALLEGELEEERVRSQQLKKQLADLRGGEADRQMNKPTDWMASWGCFLFRRDKR